jgi:pimeloyl-ACP methyl ester carboxylesterase
VLKRLEEFGGSGEPMLFAHANGYPVGSYRQLIEALLPTCKVTGFHHRPIWSPELPPARLNWKAFADDLIETVASTQTEPVWMMGHSMGATVATFAAARRPELFRGLVLIDPVYVLRRRAAVMRLTRQRKLDSMPMIRKTLTRPNRFASQQEAFDFHRPKRAFSGLSDQVMWDYILASTHQGEDGEFQLTFGREWEAAAYRSTPFVWGSVKKIRLPVLGLRGETSNTLSKKAFARWQRLQPQADLRECKGGHLLPLEFPRETADQVLDFLQLHSPAQQVP